MIRSIHSGVHSTKFSSTFRLQTNRNVFVVHFCTNTIHQFSQCKVHLKIRQTIICVSILTLTVSWFLTKMKNKGESWTNFLPYLIVGCKSLSDLIPLNKSPQAEIFSRYSQVALDPTSTSLFLQLAALFQLRWDIWKPCNESTTFYSMAFLEKSNMS